jgi:hypothetical protein
MRNGRIKAKIDEYATRLNTDEATNATFVLSLLERIEVGKGLTRDHFNPVRFSPSG